MQPMITPLKAAFKLSGGQASVARALKISRSTVNSWVSRGFPISRCIDIEKATKGVVHRQLMRPDDWHVIWPTLRHRAHRKDSN